MRGKKVDAEFVSEFIVDCAKRKITNPTDVAKEAEKQIISIDQKIKEVEALKKIRSKLTDVISTLTAKVKDNSEEKKALSFYQLSNLSFTQMMTTRVRDEPFDIKLLRKESAHLIKEILAAKILNKEGDQLVQGDEYQNFLDFCLNNGYSCLLTLNTLNTLAREDFNNPKT